MPLFGLIFLRIHTLSHQASGYICKGHLCFHTLSDLSWQFVCCIGDVVVIWSTCVTYYDSVQLGEFKVRPKEEVCSLESTFSQFTQKSQEIILFSFKKTSREDQEKPQTAFLWFKKGSRTSEYLYFVKREIVQTSHLFLRRENHKRISHISEE